MTAIINLFSSYLNSAVFVLLIVLVVVFWLIYKVTQVATNWQNKESDIAQLKDRWDRDVPYIKERVNLMYSKIFGGVLQNASPITLTDIGQEIATKIGAERIVDLHIE